MCQWYGLHVDTWDAGELGEVQRFLLSITCAAFFEMRY